MENFFPLNNVSILEDSSELNYPSKATLLPGKRKTPKQSTPIQRNIRKNFLARRQTWKPQWPCIDKRKLQTSLWDNGLQRETRPLRRLCRGFQHFPDGSKVVEFKENPTKTRQGGLRNRTRCSPQQMWSTNGGDRDPIKLFEEWLEHRPDVLKKSGPLYLTIIPRPTSNTWYSKTLCL